MSEPKLISPLLDGFAMGEPISSHDGVLCCPAMQEDSDQKYIVKIISVPASQTQLDALLLTGAYPNAEAAQGYFAELADGILKETRILKKLSGVGGFLAFDNSQCVAMESGVGYDIYLLGEYRRSLERRFRQEPLTHLGAVNLGIDLCAAMAVCRRAGFLYVDLKPGNVYLVDATSYRIGDIGFVPMKSLKYTSLPSRFLSPWTAPEVRDAMATLNPTVDIYALGLILYQAYNNGALPFDQEPPQDPLPPPMYADYEMAEIILKACAPDPKDRWQDPNEMGRALVSYMQRNGANDTPIIPPKIDDTAPLHREETGEEADAPEDAPAGAVSSGDAAPSEAVPAGDMEAPADGETPAEAVSGEAPSGEEAAPAEEPSEEDTPVEEPEIPEDPDSEELGFIRDLVSDDETAPGEADVAGLEDAALSEEASDILAQAEELIAHEPPGPAVAPEPVEVKLPEEVTAETEEAADASPEEAPEEAPAEIPLVSPEERARRRARTRQILKRTAVITASVVAAVALLFGCWFYYQNYYLQPITSVTLECDGDGLIVHVVSPGDQSLLTVKLTDAFGNLKTSPVSDGAAVFAELTPNSQYTIELEVSGFHKLSGTTRYSYSTRARTNIVNFTASAGAEDGSVILNFTVDGQDAPQWTIGYGTQGQEEQFVSFEGHMTTISGLTVGSTYVFRLVPGDDIYLVGTDSLEYTASKVFQAENLTVTELTEDAVTVAWSAPQGVGATDWIVHCYGEDGYDNVQTVSETTATFTGLDTASAHTIEVAAQGMTLSARIYLTANPIIVTAIHGNNEDPNQILLTWEYTGVAPEGGWLLMYTVDDSQDSQVVQCAEASAVVSPKVPGSHYNFTLQATNGASVFGGTFSVDTEDVEAFAAYDVTGDNMEFSMCRTPENPDWTRRDLADEDYTTEFAVGEKASFSVHMNKVYNVSYDQVVTAFVIRDTDGNFVSANSTTRTWDAMWDNGYCELDIPALPAAPGSYTVSIYFNGRFVTSQTFSMAE